MKILLHICCAPCAIYPLRILREMGHEVTGFFYNPNIHPYLEYRRRLDTLSDYASRAGLEFREDEGYALEEYFRAITFREKERCRACYDLRLTRTAAMSRAGGFDGFTTTLLYSRYQNHDLIRDTGEALAKRSGAAFFYLDFRTGWKEGVERSKEMGLYRQPYCGCLFSEAERYRKAEVRKAGSGC
jgi:predicted adenine nucleotide alpha hydrolase (AANH) superfamily ATPase